MVEEQLAAPPDRRSAVLSVPVLQAMRAVPRHRFVPRELAARAYADEPLPLGTSQTISQPYIVGKMTELLEVGAGARVLEIGTGSGYQAAVLAQMGARVTSIELDAALAAAASLLFAELRLAVDVRVGDGRLGAADVGPFDAIVVTAASGQLAKAWREQLAEGGRLVAPIGPRKGVQALHRFRRRGAQLVDEPLFAVRFVPLEVGKDDDDG